MGPLGLLGFAIKKASLANVRIVDLICASGRAPSSRLGLAAGAAVFFASRGHLRLWSAAIAGWNAFAVVILALDWVTILTTPQRKIRERAQQQDLSRLLIFIFVVVTACAALFAVGFLVSANKESRRRAFHRSSAAHALNRDFFLDAGSDGLRFPLRPRVLWR